MLPVNPSVLHTLAQQSNQADDITFPVALSENTPLSANDYAYYLTRTQDQYLEQKKSLKTLTLTKGVEALPGLLQYLQSSPKLFFNQLVIHIPITPEVIKDLEPLLMGLAAIQLPSLTFTDDRATTEQVDALINVIIKNKTAIEINLPQGSSKEQQRQLDEQVSDFKREQRIQYFETKAPPIVRKNKADHAIKRTRILSKKKNVSIEQAQEQEIQVDVAVEIGVEKSVMDEADDILQLDLINRDSFVAQGHEKTVWDIWLGNIEKETVLYENPLINHLTQRACDKLLAHTDQLQYGLDLQRLPAGFLFVKVMNNGHLVIALDYNEKKAKLAKPDPLAVKLTTPVKPAPLSHTLFERWLSKEPKTAKEQALFTQYQVLLMFGYDRHLVNAFKQRLLLELDIEKNSALGQFIKKWRKTRQFTPKFTPKNNHALLAVYDAYGERGIEKLFSRFEEWQKESLLSPLFNNHIAKCHTWVPLLDEHYQAAIQGIRFFSLEQRAWWDSLYQQHSSAVGEDDLPALVKSFQAFITQTTELGLRLYTPCHFKNVKNLPVALSRMLTILKNCKSYDLAEQWECITALDLQSNAAIRAITDVTTEKNWGAFVIPEMQTTPEYYDKEHRYKKQPLSARLLLPQSVRRPNLPTPIHQADPALLPLSGYHALAAMHEKTLASPLFIPKVRDEVNSLLDSLSFSKDEAELQRNFYRYLAASPHSLPLTFYKKAITLIETHHRNAFTIQRDLYTLLAGATTGLEAKALLDDEEKSLQQIEAICKALREFSLPGPIALLNDFFRSVSLEYLEENLSNIPLPYLSKLIVPIFKELSTFHTMELINPKAVKEKWEKIEAPSISMRSLYTYQLAFIDGLKFSSIEKMTDDTFIKKLDAAHQIRCLAILFRDEKSVRNIHNKQSSEKRAAAYQIFSLEVSLKERLKSALIRLVGLFNIERDAVALILQTIQQHASPITLPKEENLLQAILFSLVLLGKMDNPICPATQQTPTSTDLINFIKAIKEHLVAEAEKNTASDLTQCALTFVQENYSGYFSDDTLRALSTSALADDIVKRINSRFSTREEQELVCTLLMEFGKAEDRLHREKAVTYLARLCDDLSSTERKSFLLLLNTLNNKHDNRLETLCDLLLAIGKKSNIQDAVFLSSQAETKTATRLIEKMCAFYTETIPLIETNKSESLFRVDILPLAAKISLMDTADDSFVTHTLTAILDTVNAYPTEKSLILLLIETFRYKIQQQEKAADELTHFVSTLQKEFDALGSTDVIRSLCHHYQEKPDELLNTLTLVSSLEKEKKLPLLSMVTSLLNNEKRVDFNQLRQLVERCKKQPDFLATAQQCYAYAPYPDLDQLLQWEDITAEYQKYHLKPCEREPDNGFKLEEANKQKNKFSGITFDAPELENLNNHIQAVKDYTSLELKETLANMQKEDHALRVAVLAEILYRSKGSAGGHGNSYELNTTQYLAVLAFLKSHGHVTSEIATGEGKSRIMMLSAACQFSMGKTVDFVTSNMQLALRDYLEYQSFFKTLGAKTQLITADSASTRYTQGGIHFSDASNLSLFRNKAKSRLEGNNIIDPTPEKRALLLDEADQTYFDVSETRYNYSQQASEEIKGMEWVYPILVRFFNQKDKKIAAKIETLYEKDMDACNTLFFEFASVQPECTDDEKREKLTALPRGQIEAWQDAAVTAMSLKLGDDFAIETNVLSDTSLGPKLSSEARLIYGHRLSRNSKYSFGVQQCLHAYLNEALKDPTSAITKYCAALNAKKIPPQTSTHAFHIHPEKQIVYSSTSKSLLDDYAKGDVYAVTGSAGAIIEREEAGILYGKSNASLHTMAFVTVPRQKDLNRLDQPIRLTANAEQHIQALVAYIKQAQAAGRPVLLIAENDHESSKIYKALQEKEKMHCQYVDSATTTKEESTVINQAGKPGVVTIATSRLGRGTDIRVNPEAEKAGGLLVLGTYLPRARDQMQLFGRGGRYGALGEARLVIDKHQLAKQLDKKEINTSFYLSNEFYIKSQQMRLDREKQVDRLMRQALSDFRIKITDAFFNHYDSLPADKRQTALKHWSDFSKHIDQEWNKHWPDIIKATHPFNRYSIKQTMRRFEEQSQIMWGTLHAQLKADQADGTLQKDLGKLQLNKQTKYLIKTFMPKRQFTVADKTLIYEKYDPALDGRAAIYKDIFADWKAIWHGERKLFANTRAALSGHGLLFADTRAWWAGKRPLFANLRAWMKSRHPHSKKEPATKDIMVALRDHDAKSLKKLIHDVDAAKLIQGQMTDRAFNVKRALVESVLDFAHHKIETHQKIADKEMDDMSRLLKEMTDSKYSNREALLQSIDNVLAADTSMRFFGKSLKRKVAETVAQLRAERDPPTQKR